MAQAIKSAKKKAKLPIIVLTEREILLELGPQCPKPIVDAIMDSGEPKKKLKEIKDALGEIVRVCEKREGWGKAELWPIDGGKGGRLVAPGRRLTPPSVGLEKLLANEGIAGLFTKHTQAFVEIAGTSGYRAFEALGDERVGMLFDFNPQEFVEIAEIAGGHANEVFGLFGGAATGSKLADYPKSVLESMRRIRDLPDGSAELIFEGFGEKNLSEFFSKDLELAVGTFGAIARAAGAGAKKAIEAIMQMDKVGGLLSRHSQAFVEIAEATGEMAWSTFGIIAQYRLEWKFDLYPSKFVEIAQRKGVMADEVFTKIGKMGGCGAFTFYCGGTMTLDEFLKKIKNK